MNTNPEWWQKAFWKLVIGVSLGVGSVHLSALVSPIQTPTPLHFALLGLLIILLGGGIWLTALEIVRFRGWNTDDELEDISAEVWRQVAPYLLVLFVLALLTLALAYSLGKASRSSLV